MATDARREEVVKEGWSRFKSGGVTGAGLTIDMRRRKESATGSAVALRVRAPAWDDTDSGTAERDRRRIEPIEESQSLPARSASSWFCAGGVDTNGLATDARRPRLVALMFGDDGGGDFEDGDGDMPLVVVAYIDMGLARLLPESNDIRLPNPTVCGTGALILSTLWGNTSTSLSSGTVSYPVAEAGPGTPGPPAGWI